MTIILSQQDLLSQPLQVAGQWLQERRPAAIATVIETWGSAPCPAGSHLLIDSDANFFGSVSGGCVEADVIAQAMDVIADGQAKVLEFGIADERAWRAGLSCGGRIRILVTRLTAHFGEIGKALEHRRGGRLLTHIQSGAQQLFTEGNARPETVSGPFGAALATAQPRVVVVDQQEYFLNMYTPRPRLILVGAVHISQNLRISAKLTGFDVSIIDPRSAFATPERFGDADLHTLWPQDYFDNHPPDRHTAVAALTHDPKIDDEALIAAIRARAFYIGALGSRKTHAARLERFYQAGLSPDECALIHAPIGLDIKAQGPAEIAIAVLAQVISAWRTC